jgi:hypothetical protein
MPALRLRIAELLVMGALLGLFTSMVDACMPVKALVAQHEGKARGSEDSRSVPWPRRSGVACSILDLPSRNWCLA